MTLTKVISWFLLFAHLGITVDADYPAVSSSLDGIDLGPDPALKEMTVDLGDGPQSFLAYVQPPVTSFYKDRDPPASTSVVPKHNGLAGMFINLSNKRVRLYWESYSGGPRSLIDVHEPFCAGGTATFPGHLFLFTPDDDSGTVLQRFKVKGYPESVYVYDPYHVEGNPKATKKNLKALNEKDHESYEKLFRSVEFGKEYLRFTGRSYLVNYPRPAPWHHMWRADYFNQTHWVTTRETHFVAKPPKSELRKITERGKVRVINDDQPRLLSKYRSSDGTMNMTLKVISCAPRVFEVSNFLSKVEVQHILELAAGEDLSLSSTGLGGITDDAEDDVRRTRTSYNSWLERERSPIVDAIYRRAANLLRMDEALLRHRGDGEYADLGSNKTIAESLQLVHYDPNQEYTAHHDFGFNAVADPFQAQRYATLLLYLNEGMEGGETSFPRWQNAETFDELKVVPKIGKAILFYSQLPDGNMDDLSQHEAKKVRVGEKWLVNLWVWGPVYEK